MSILARLRESAGRIRKARTEGVLTLTDPLELWVLDAGDTVREASGNEGVVRLRPGGGRYIEYTDHSLNTLSGLDFPLTVTPAK